VSNSKDSNCGFWHLQLDSIGHNKEVAVFDLQLLKLKFLNPNQIINLHADKEFPDMNKRCHRQRKTKLDGHTSENSFWSVSKLQRSEVD
jgi:hypothetical protein